mgnify:CR=1 FL=1
MPTEAMQAPIRASMPLIFSHTSLLLLPRTEFLQHEVDVNRAEHSHDSETASHYYVEELFSLVSGQLSEAHQNHEGYASEKNLGTACYLTCKGSVPCLEVLSLFLWFLPCLLLL